VQQLNFFSIPPKKESQMYTTDQYEGMIAETITHPGANGDVINAYFARPLGPGPFPGMVIVHHMPGWDEWYRECARRFAHHGYLTISPNLYFRAGHGTPEDVAAKGRGAFPMSKRLATWPGRCNISGRCPN
jgi:dienelactone hydrolase